MADWPDRDAVKLALGMDDRTDKDEAIDRALAAAIEGVVDDCGGSPVTVTVTDGTPSVELTDPSPSDYTPVEIPVTSKLSQAALQLVVRVYKGPDAPFGVASTFDTGGLYVARHDPIYLKLLKGNRQRFGIA